jgi:hypothetical protein
MATLNEMGEAEQRDALIELAATYDADDLPGFSEAAVEFGKVGAADAVRIFRDVHGIRDTASGVGVDTADGGSLHGE